MVTIQTATLKSVLSKVVKESVINGFVPITEMCKISQKNKDFLAISTTNATSVFTMCCAVDEPNDTDFSIVVDIDVLQKLVYKLDCEILKFKCTDESLVIISDTGKYTIPARTDSGNKIDMPDIIQSNKKIDHEEIYADMVRDIAKLHRASLPTNQKVMPTLFGYYFSKDFNVSTNSISICLSNIATFSHSATMFSPETLDMLSQFDDVINADKYENGVWSFYDDIMRFDCAEMVDEISEYPIGAIQNLYKTNCDGLNYIEVDRTDLINVIDRMNLFVGVYDSGGVDVKIEDGHIEFTTVNSCANEKMFISAKTPDTQFRINVNLLKAQLKSMTNDSISLGIGNNKFIVLKDDLTTRIVALQEV